MNILKFGYFPWKYPSNWFRNFKQFFKNIKFAYQRITRGYADCDIWSFDVYLAEIISKGTSQLARTTHSYPTDMTPVEWENYLTTISEIFNRYLENIDGGLYMDMEDLIDIDWYEYRKGFDMLSARFSDLWD